MSKPEDSKPGPIRRWLARLTMTVGTMTILAYVAFLAIAFFDPFGKTVPAATILELDLDRDLILDGSPSPLEALLERDATTLRSVVAALERAKKDDRVHGLVADLGSRDHGLAIVQELRAAIASFRESGKPALAFADTFGELGPANQAYYLATAFDEIWVQPSGSVGLTGLSAEVPFVRRALEKIGVIARLDHRGKFKTAMNTFTEDGLTDAHRLSLEGLLEDLFSQIVAGVAEGRGLDPGTTRTLVDRGPFLAEEAIDAGLVDSVGYRDEALARIRELAEEPDAELLYVGAYADRLEAPEGDLDPIALVYAVGTIHRGPSEVDPLSGEASLGADTLAATLREVAADDDVKAVVLRIDSPGGSYVASDVVWRETVRLRETGKPFVVSMGNVAASGGYFIAMNANHIVAEPATITGSIGVFAGKMITRDLWEKIGVSWGRVSTSRNADMWSSLEDYDEDAWKRFQTFLDVVYDDFTSKVAAGRGLPIERVREVARGRVWAGSDAKELGLVDELGGLLTALRAAKRLAGIDEDQLVELRTYPQPMGLLEMLLEGPPDSSEPARTAAALALGLRELAPWLAAIRADAGERTLALPYVPRFR